MSIVFWIQVWHTFFTQVVMLTSMEAYFSTLCTWSGHSHPRTLAYFQCFFSQLESGKHVFVEPCIVTMVEFLCMSIFGDFQIFVVTCQEKCAALMCTIVFFLGYPENVKYPPCQNCISCSSQNHLETCIYLGVKMTSLDQKHKIVMKVANLGISKSRIPFSDIKLLGKLSILM